MPKGFGHKAHVSYTPGFWRSLFRLRPKSIQEFHTEIDVFNKEITTWIPSKVGKDFEIRWTRLESGELPTTGYFYADGECLGGRIRTSKDSPVIFRSVITSDKTRRRFHFSPRDTNKSLRDASLINEVGEIRIDIYEATVGERIPVGTYYDVQANDGVHEKLKKGIVHVVGFSRDKKKKNICTDVTLHGRLVTIRFKYRPLGTKYSLSELLQAHLLTKSYYVDVLKADGIVSTSEKYCEK